MGELVMMWMPGGRRTTKKCIGSTGSQEARAKTHLEQWSVLARPAAGKDLGDS